MLKIVKNLLWVTPFISFIAGYLVLAKIYPTKEIETPSIVGKSLQDACIILATHSLNARLISRKEDAFLPEGTVITQTPLAKQKIKPNQTVFIVATTLPAKNIAPDCIKKDTLEAEQLCVQNDIKAKIYPMPSHAKQGACIAQWPEPGAALEHNRMVLYCAQHATKPFIMPYLKNKNAATVMTFLQANGSVVSVIHEGQEQRENHTCDTCIVADQRPLAGSIIAVHQDKPLSVQLSVKEQV